jgi:hypothetical protein
VHGDKAQHGMGGGSQWEGADAALPWASMHLPSTVQGTSSQRGLRATEMRGSPVWSTAPKLNGGEGVNSSGWGAAPSSGEALGPAHGEEGGVRWLGTDGVVGSEARRRGGGLPEMNKMLWRRQDAMGAASF